jgi:DNA repair protein RadC
MKRLAPEDRPREKLSRLGVDALGDNELVAIVLGHGSRAQPVLDVANALLTALGGVHGLTRATHDDLRGIAGVGPVRAAQVLAAVELGRRTLVRAPAPREQLLSPRDVAAYLLPKFGAHGVERFGLLLFDSRYRVIRTTLLSVGGVDSAPAHPREIFRVASAGGATAVVLFHNHPSGDPSPSSEDVRLTVRLARAGEVMGIEVVDHVILADNRYYSFREAGTLTAS